MVVVVASSVLLAMAATSAGAVTFDATDSVPSTAGGARFDQDVGVDYAKQVLSDASSFIWDTFNQPNPEDRKPVDSVVVLTVVDSIVFSGTSVPAATSGNAISLSGCCTSFIPKRQQFQMKQYMKCTINKSQLAIIS